MIPYAPTQDTFQTQADDRFNSFQDPWNGVNANGGMGQGWGVDPSYLTPAYLSPYRPAYQGSMGDPRTAYSPSFLTSANQVFNPFAPGGTNYGGSSYLQQSPFYDSLGYKPIDATVQGMQKYVIPTMMSAIAFKYLNKPSNALGRGLGVGLTKGLLKGVVSDSVAANIAGKVGWAGGLASEMFLPLAAAQAAIHGIDHYAFKPYIAQRQMDNSLTRNFSGVTFGDDSGNVINGQGLSRAKSTKIAKELSQTAAKDLTFNQAEVAQLTDFAGRSGLFDNVNGDQIAGRMKAILKQVKVVMSAANTSDFREAIEILSKLQLSGVDPNKLGKTITTISGLAKAAGTSVQKLMSTVGAQGEYLFQANGLTPYVGQLKAAQSYASFEASYRSGLISPALMARMGGKEGATQSAVAGMVGMGESPFATMMAHNGFVGQGVRDSIVGNVAAFGSDMTKNPLEALGNLNLSRPALVSKFLEKDGLPNVEKMIKQVAQVTPGAIDPQTGKVSAGAAYQILTGTFGLPDDKSRALLAQMQTYQDPTSVKQLNAGLNAAQIDSSMKFKDQNSLSLGVATLPYLWARDKSNKVESAVSGWVGNQLQSVGGGIDSFEKGFAQFKYGSDTGYTAEQLSRVEASPTYLNIGKLQARSRKPGSGMMIQNMGTPTKEDIAKRVEDLHKEQITGKHFQAFEAINELAAKGDSDAKIAITKKGNDRSDALFRLSNRGLIDSKYKNISEIKDLSSSIDFVGTDNFKNHQTAVDKVKALAKAGNRDAQMALENSGAGRETNLLKLAREGKIDAKYKDEGNVANLSGALANNNKTLTGDQIVGQALGKVIKTRDSHGKLNQEGGLEAAEYIGLAQDAQRLIAENKTETPEYKEVRNRLKAILGRGPNQELGIAEVKAFADKAMVSSMGSGTSHMGELFRVSGIGSYKEFKDKMSKPGAGKYLSSIIGGKYTDEQARGVSEQTILTKLAEKNGVKVLEPSMDPKALKYLDPAELRRQHDEQEALRAEHMNIEKLRKSGLIDFNTASNMQNAIDQKETVKKFEDAVGEFAKSVKEMPTGTSGTTSSGARIAPKEEGVGWHNSTLGKAWDRTFGTPKPRNPN